jgi:hypothetical protein
MTPRIISMIPVWNHAVKDVLNLTLVIRALDD